MKFSDIHKIVLHLLWPVSCPVCHKPAEIICHDCIKSLFWEKVITRKVDSLTINSAAFYHTYIDEIIFAFKYSGYRALCRPIGAAMSEFFGRPDDIDCLIPVPLHVNSPRKYNQAHEIAKGLCKEWDIKILDAAKWSRVMPRRVGLSAKDRMKLSTDAFKILRDIDLTGLNVALVDDVCTTGTTLLRLSEVCEISGANVKCAYTLATVRE